MNVNVCRVGYSLIPNISHMQLSNKPQWSSHKIYSFKTVLQNRIPKDVLDVINVHSIYTYHWVLCTFVCMDKTNNYIYACVDSL